MEKRTVRKLLTGFPERNENASFFFINSNNRFTFHCLIFSVLFKKKNERASRRQTKHVSAIQLSWFLPHHSDVVDHLSGNYLLTLSNLHLMEQSIKKKFPSHDYPITFTIRTKKVLLNYFQ